MQNPRLVALADRNDLDDQHYGKFQRCADILGQTPTLSAIGAADASPAQRPGNGGPKTIKP